MAYKNPTTQIVLIKGCPLDRNYNNTFYFHNKAVQENFFTKNYLNGGSIYTKSFYSAYSYQRYEEGEIFIEGRYDRMIGHNYICFKNFKDGKWYYGFIDDMEYINENTTRVSYTIDVMQTWYFEYTMTTTFVEREHTETDVVGEHLVPEGFEVGEMVSTRISNYSIGELLLIINYAPNYSTFLGVDSVQLVGGIDGTVGQPTTGGSNNYKKLFNSVVKVPNTIFSYFIHINSNNYQEKIMDVVTKITDLKGEVVSIFAVPNKLVTLKGYKIRVSSETAAKPLTISYNPSDDITFDTDYVWVIDELNSENFTFSQSIRFHDINGYYQPRNKKMYTHPYTSVIVTNNNGANNTYYWEESARRQTDGLKIINFNVDLFYLNKPLLNLYPTDYRGLAEDFENSVSKEDFIEMSWSVDSFARWWSENKSTIALTAIKSGIMGVASPLVSGEIALNSYKANNPKGTKGERIKEATIKNSAMSTGMSTFGSIVDTLGQGVKASATPDAYNIGNYDGAYNRYKEKDGFTAYNMTCHTDIAESIDNYFTMFGYAIKKLKVPNIKNYEAKLRPHWNFVKTAGCHIMPAWETTDDVITGTRNSIPKEAEELINSIYDKGVTFWMHNGGELGDYTLDNSPTV